MNEKTKELVESLNNIYYSLDSDLKKEMKPYYFKLFEFITNPFTQLTLSIDGSNRKKQEIIVALSSTQGNRAEAAKILGISERTLYRKLVNYGINL